MLTPLPPSLLPWAITFGLLSIVTAGFGFSGTVSNYLSLLVRILAGVFLVFALVLAFVKPRTPGTRR